MANEQNLKPRTTLSKEEAKRLGRKGGIASVEARRKRKTLKEELLLLLETENYNNRISLSMIMEALKGNTKAFEIIRDTVGEKPKEQLEVEQAKPFEVNIKVKK